MSETLSREALMQLAVDKLAELRRLQDLKARRDRERAGIAPLGRNRAMRRRDAHLRRRGKS